MSAPRIITARSIGLAFRQGKLADMGPEKEVTGHYSATDRAKDWRAGVASAKSFHQHHLGKGWAGIGYHYLISDDGAIICCRPVLYQGAHVEKANDARVGVNMPGKGNDRPTRAQARAFWWLLHNAHTGAFARPHRCDRDLSKMKILGHREVPGQSTLCPGKFLGMYKRGGDPWREGIAPDAREFVELTPDDESLEVPEGRGAVEDTESATGPEQSEAQGGSESEELELPEPDDEYDEDLSAELAEIEAPRGS